MCLFVSQFARPPTLCISLRRGWSFSPRTGRVQPPRSHHAMAAFEVNKTLPAALQGLEPAGLWGFFGQLASIPRPSYQEQRWGSALAGGGEGSWLGNGPQRTGSGVAMRICCDVMLI